MGRYTIDTAAVARLRSEREIDDSVRHLAHDIYDDSQRLVAQPGGGDDPYATGALKASGFVDGNDSEYRIGYTSDHAAYVEFGTSEMDAEPYLSPAAFKKRRL